MERRADRKVRRLAGKYWQKRSCDDFVEALLDQGPSIEISCQASVGVDEMDGREGRTAEGDLANPNSKFSGVLKSSTARRIGTSCQPP